MIVITEKSKCSGCYACLHICPQNCITMEIDPEGFWYPFVDDTKCIQCGRCDDVCPVINRTEVENEPKAYACINKDEAVRMESSSGGIFTLIAEQSIDRGGVVFGAGFDADLSICHSYVATKVDLGRFRGSKYVQSRIGETYGQAKDFLDRGREVLFSGTPCQIAGFKSYLGNPYDNLFCVDFICHGVPSPKVWQKYISYREQCAGGKVQDISFRKKIDGWRKFSMWFSFTNGKEYHMTIDKDLFMQAFMETSLRPSCYSCEFKSVHRQSDITLGDFWGVQHISPDLDDNKGTSLIFVNSDRGHAMFDIIKGDILYQDVDINQAVNYNTTATSSVMLNPRRKVFFRKIGKLPFDKLVKRYCLPSLYQRIKKKTVRSGVKIKNRIRSRILM